MVKDTKNEVVEDVKGRDAVASDPEGPVRKKVDGQSPIGTRYPNTEDLSNAPDAIEEDMPSGVLPEAE